MASYTLDPNRKAPSFDPFADVKNRAVTFDLYGCLLNFRLIPHFVGQVARERKLSPELAEMYFNLYYSRVMYGENIKSYRSLLARVLSYVDMEMDTTNVFTGCLDELYLMHADLRPTPEVMDTLSYLKHKNIQMFILSNSDKFLTHKVMEIFPSFFDDKHIITVDETLCFKPNLDYFKAAADKFKLRSFDHFHVSSNYFTDVVPARTLHWDTIYINRRKTGVLQECVPDMMIPSLKDLKDAMIWVRINQIEEEKAAQLREAEAAAKAEAEEKAREEAKAAAKAAHNAEVMAAHKAELEAQQQHARHQHLFNNEVTYDPSIDGLGAFDGTFTPLNLNNPRDAKIAAKLKSVSPARARAIAAARERALAYAKANGSF